MSRIMNADWSELNSLVFCVKQVEKTAVDVTEDADEIDGAFQLKPKMSVCVTSKDMMQLTLTSTCLDVLNNLSKVCWRDNIDTVGQFSMTI